MNKEAAIELMKEGVKITHESFTKEEWMTYENGRMLLEDGVKCSRHEFWGWRMDSCWDDGYSRWEA